MNHPCYNATDERFETTITIDGEDREAVVLYRVEGHYEAPGLYCPGSDFEMVIEKIALLVEEGDIEDTDALECIEATLSASVVLGVEDAAWHAAESTRHDGY